MELIQPPTKFHFPVRYQEYFIYLPLGQHLLKLTLFFIKNILLKNLTGHSNDIFRMLFTNSSLLSNTFVSAATNDRVLNMWSLENQSTAALGSFTINDGPVYIDLACVTNEETKENTTILCAVTAKGQLFVYKHVTNGEKKLKKPIKACHQITVQTHEGIPLPVFGAFVTNEFNERLENFKADSELTVYFVYGFHVNPIIEKMVS